MKTQNQEICECGHQRGQHEVIGIYKRDGKKRRGRCNCFISYSEEGCPCKKFKPQNNSSSSERLMATGKPPHRDDEDTEPEEESENIVSGSDDESLNDKTWMTPSMEDYPEISGLMVIDVKDVKEAVKKLKGSTIFNILKKDSSNWYDILIKTIDNIFGSELTK